MPDECSCMHEKLNQIFLDAYGNRIFTAPSCVCLADQFNGSQQHGRAKTANKHSFFPPDLSLAINGLIVGK